MLASFLRRAGSGAPNGAATSGLPILNGVSNYLKANAAEQRSIFVEIQAGVIEGVAPMCSDAFTIGGSAVKHQHGRSRGMPSEHAKHLALVVWPKVKKAIPGEDTIKTAGEL